MAQRRQVNLYGMPGMQQMGYAAPYGNYMQPAPPVYRRQQQRAPQQNVGHHHAPAYSQGHHQAPPRSHGHYPAPSRSQGHRPQQQHKSHTSGHSGRQVTNHGQHHGHVGASHPGRGHPGHGHPGHNHVAPYGGGYNNTVSNVYNDNHQMQSNHPQTQYQHHSVGQYEGQESSHDVYRAESVSPDYGNHSDVDKDNQYEESRYSNRGGHSNSPNEGSDTDDAQAGGEDDDGSWREDDE